MYHGAIPFLGNRALGLGVAQKSFSSRTSPWLADSRSIESAGPRSTRRVEFIAFCFRTPRFMSMRRMCLQIERRRRFDGIWRVIDRDQCRALGRTYLQSRHFEGGKSAGRSGRQVEQSMGRPPVDARLRTE
jgi:hypothetical protein